MFLSMFILLLVSRMLWHKVDRCKYITNILLFSKKFKNKPCFFIKHSVYYQRCSAKSTYNCIWRGILMVRSHIGNVVCRKALCVRVASSPPSKSKQFGRVAWIFLFLLTHLRNEFGNRTSMCVKYLCNKSFKNEKNRWIPPKGCCFL